jgi:hypothetical protein
MVDNMTTTPPTVPVAPMKRSIMRWILVASLTANFLVVGLAIGAAIGGHDMHRPRSIELALGPFARALDEGDRRAIARDLMMRDGMRPPSRAERAYQMEQLVSALKAAPYSPDDVKAIVESQSSWVQQMQTAAQEAVLERINAMAPEARLAFADRLGRGIGRMPDDQPPPD